MFSRNLRAYDAVTCLKRGADEGRMNDNLMGRLVGNAGVACTAAGSAESTVMHFLLTREPSRR